MKTHQLIKKGISLILAVMMLSGVLFGALRVSASSGIIMSHEIDMRPVSGYPVITFYDENGKAISDLTGVKVNMNDLSFSAKKVSYVDKDGKNQRKKYSKVDLWMAYADANYPLIPNSNGGYVNQPDEEYAWGTLTLGDQEFRTDEIQFSKTKNNYLMAIMKFNDIELFDDYNDQAEVYLQYVTKDNDGKQGPVTRGLATYTFSKAETPLKDEEANKEDGDGDISFGDGENNNPILPPDGEVEI